MSTKSRIAALLGSALMVATLVGTTAAPVAARHTDPTLFGVITAAEKSDRVQARSSASWGYVARTAKATLTTVRIFRNHGNIPPWLVRSRCGSATRAMLGGIIRENFALLRYARGQVNGFQYALNPLRAKILRRAAYRGAARNQAATMTAWEDCISQFAPRRFHP